MESNHDILPITDQLAEKLVNASDKLSVWVEMLEDAYRNGEKYVSQVFVDDLGLVEAYLKNLRRMIFDEAPMNQEPIEAGELMADIDDAVVVIKRDNARSVLDAYEVLGDTLSLIDIIIGRLDLD